MFLLSTNMYNRTGAAIGSTLKFSSNENGDIYHIRDHLVLTQNRKGSWGLPSLYISTSNIWSDSFLGCDLRLYNSYRCLTI